MTWHVGYVKNKPDTNPKGGTRNGKSKKTLKGKFGELPIETTCDREDIFALFM